MTRSACGQTLNYLSLAGVGDPRTLNVPVDDAVLVEDIDGCGDLLAVEPDDVLLQAQSGDLLQGALVAVLHEDVHLLLRDGACIGEAQLAPITVPRRVRMCETYPVELHSKVPHQVWVFDAFEDLQLVGRLLDGFVIVWLKPDLVGRKNGKRERTWVLAAELLA